MQLARELIIDASAEQVWAVVAHDFANVGQWASGVAHSTPNLNAVAPPDATVGGRVCNVPGFGEIHETFTHYDEQGMTFTYAATGMPFMVKSAKNTWNITPLGANKTKVEFSLDMQLIPIIGSLMAIPMRIQLGTLLENYVEELKVYVEDGTIHPRKHKMNQQNLKQATT